MSYGSTPQEDSPVSSGKTLAVFVEEHNESMAGNEEKTRMPKVRWKDEKEVISEGNQTQRSGTVACDDRSHPLSSGRNLVVCIDGTSQQFCEKSSNVVEIYSRLIKNEEQLTYYSSGLGTYAKSSWKPWSRLEDIYAIFDKLFALRFDKILLSAYFWLSSMYQPGDRIYLFGFSRGAYQVRALSGMIEKVGLIHKGNEDQIPFAYNLYCQSGHNIDRDAGNRGQSKRQDAPGFKRAFCRDVKVHFVGVWDTVSSIGVFRSDRKRLPLTINGMEHVCFFRHALALDDRRVKFLPEFVRGGQGPKPEQTKGEFPHIKEVWFTGTHSDVGGGSTKNTELNKNGPALRWMIRESTKAGLLLEPFSGDWSKVYGVGEIQESMNFGWKIFEYLFLKRLTYANAKNPDEATHRPHRSEERRIVPGQLIHQSVYSAMDGNYYTTRLPRQFHDQEQRKSWVEPDSFDRIAKDVYSYVDKWAKLEPAERSQHLEGLRMLSQSEEGRLAFIDLAQRLTRPLEDNEKYTKARAIMSVLIEASPPQQRRHITDMPLMIRTLLKESRDEEMKELVKGYLKKFGDGQIRRIFVKTEVSSVTFSPDNGTVVTGGARWEVLLNKVEHGDNHPSLRGHEGFIHCAAYCPVLGKNDSQLLVTGSSDRTVRIWDSRSGKRLDVLEGHTNAVLSVCFSPDGGKVLTAGADCTILLWKNRFGNEPASSDAKSKTPRPQLLGPGHQGRVYTALFSPGGEVIISASSDKTICIWDGESLQMCSTLFEHARTIAFDPDGEHFYSGSVNGTIKKWHIVRENELWKAEEVEGSHLTIPEDMESSIRSIAISRGGMIVAGLSDGTVLMWRKDSTEPHFQGRGPTSSPIASIACSPNGKYIATGSSDGYVVLWDADGPDGEGILAELTQCSGNTIIPPPPKSTLEAHYPSERIHTTRVPQLSTLSETSTMRSLATT